MLPGIKMGFLHSLRYLNEILGKTKWIVVRDFKLIKDLGDNKSFIQWLDPISQDFQATVKDMGTKDTDFKNGSFT